MTNTNTSPAVITTAHAPVELHYVKKIYIDTGTEATALCGLAIDPVTSNGGAGNGTSYTCPDCILRYTLLGGGAKND